MAGLWAEAFPQRIPHLVLVGAPALRPMPAQGVRIKEWRLAAPGPQRDAIHRHNLRQMMFAHEQTADALALKIHAENMDRDRLRRRKLARTDALVQLLPRLQARVDGIWGAADALYTGALDVVATALRHAPGFGRLVLIPDAGHWVQHEAPEVFNPALLDLLGAAA